MAAPYYGWYVVAASEPIACFSWGFAFYGLGVYQHVLVRLHGWPTGAISVAVTACDLIGALLIIAAGRLIDRHGPRGARLRCLPDGERARSARADLYVRGNCGPSGRRPS